MLKILIWVMTGLLVAGLIALLIGFARTAGKMSADAAVGEHLVKLPEGAELLGIEADSGRLYLSLKVDGETQILIVDAASGRRLGLLRLEEDGDD